MSKIQLCELAKTYGAFQALYSINESIEGPEFVVILGPSGCGKSTLLRMIAGLETITSGDLFVDGERVNDVPPHKRDMAMVFQNYALYPHLTVFDNLAYGLRIRKTQRSEIIRRVNEVARMLHLEPFLERKPSQLSGGQRQRVAMGRAIVRSPKAFLFDEPLSNLDAKLRNEMRVEIRRVHDAVNGTSIFVTHDQVEAMTMADRIIVMNAGRIVQTGAPTDIYNMPANKFVATFVGSPAMNILPATIREDGTLNVPGAESSINLGRRIAEPGRAVEVGIRPEHLELNTSSPNRVELEVSFIEMLGAETVVHGRLAGLPIAGRLQGQQLLVPNSLVRLGFNAANVHVFDPSTHVAL